MKAIVLTIIKKYILIKKTQIKFLDDVIDDVREVHFLNCPQPSYETQTKWEKNVPIFHEH